jgi:hypothetical protein
MGQLHPCDDNVGSRLVLAYGEMPRPLTWREREVLDFLVSIDDPAAEALRVQATTAQVTGECDCGCGAISLEVDREGTPQAVQAGRMADHFGPITTYTDPKDPEETLWLLLWTEGGWISYIEIAWISEKPPKGLPSPEGFLPPSL